jgi:arylsulfatase A-like enzyme
MGFRSASFFYVRRGGAAGSMAVQVSAIVFLAIATPACATEAPGAAPAPNAVSSGALDDNPNVLLIAIDDLRPDLGVFGHPTAITPNIDAFAKTGLLFERAYTQQAVCGPSRAALMSGLRPETTGITTLEQPLQDTVPNVVSMAAMFKANGYETMSIGKIYHHRDDDKAAWTVPPSNTMFAYRNQLRKSGKPNNAFDAVEGEELLPDEKNAARAIRELRRLKNEDKPFFMAFGVHRPHLPFEAPKAAWSLYQDKDIPDPVSRKPQKGAPDYAVVSYEIWNYDNMPKKPPMPEDLADQLRHGYLASVSFADGVVGSVLDELEKLELDDDTIVVLWSDHGFKLGDHGAWAKHSNVELDIHIPMLVRAPGRTPAGGRTKALVESVDIYPTLAELTGLTPPDDLEGLSLTPLFSKPDRVWKEAAFSQFNRGGKNAETLGRTVRTKDFRYTAWIEANTGKMVAQELYDHRNDPNELVNVASDASYKAELARHEALRKSGWRAVRDRVAK